MHILYSIARANLTCNVFYFLICLNLFIFKTNVHTHQKLTKLKIMHWIQFNKNTTKSFKSSVIPNSQSATVGGYKFNTLITALSYSLTAGESYWRLWLNDQHAALAVIWLSCHVSYASSTQHTNHASFLSLLIPGRQSLVTVALHHTDHRRPPPEFLLSQRMSISLAFDDTTLTRKSA